MGAKFGTDVDGERISGTTKILKNNEHTFVLGKTKHLFRLVVDWYTTWAS